MTRKRCLIIITKAKTIENNFDKTIRMAVLSSFTLNGIEKSLRGKMCGKKN